MIRSSLVMLALVACGGTDRIPPPQTPAPAEPVAAPASGDTAPAAAGRRIELTVTDAGFEPSPVEVKAGEQVTLVVTRKTDKTCAKEIVIKDHGIEAALPLDQPVAVSFTPRKTGELVYGCAMDQMIRGVLLVR